MSKDISKRDWFAGMALQGLLSSDPDVGLTPKEFAHDAYGIADAMIKHSEEE